VTDTTGLDTLDAQRLELLRRKMAERGLTRAGDPTIADEAPTMSDGQRRMWFVQSVDPDGALLNICVSYRVTGDVDLARLHEAVDAGCEDLIECAQSPSCPLSITNSADPVQRCEA